MQLLLAYDAPDFTLWQSAFADRAESRAQGGVNLLQIWRVADRPAAVLCLFELRDRPRTEEWLKLETALHGGRDPRFLETA